MIRQRCKALVFALILASWGCGGGGEESDAATDGQDELEDLWTFWDLMRSNALGFEYADGVWEWDQGDGRFYGTAFYVRTGVAEGDVLALQMAQEARDYNVTLLESSIADFSFYVEHLEEVMMAVLGLIEYSDATGDESFIPLVDTVIDNSNDLLSLYGDYLDVTDIESWALQLYGPTTVTGGMVLMNLQYAAYLSTDRRQDRIDRAVEIVAAIDAQVLDGSRYRFRPGEDKLYLYPNAMMMNVLCRLNELTGEEAYLTTAEGVFEAIQPLRYTERPGYYSPYSAEIMGATTEDYSTLSVHNYLTLGLMQLYDRTGDQAYLDEAVWLLRFIRDYLYKADESRLLHHWMDGQIAQPDDFEYFCSGCNLQFLYVVWYLRERIL